MLSIQHTQLFPASILPAALVFFLGCFFAFGGTFFFKFFGGLGFCLEVFGLFACHRGGGDVDLGEAALSAGIDAIAAEDAAQVVDLPAFVIAVTHDGVGRAFLGAEVAEDAIADDEFDASPCRGIGFAFLDWVEPGGGFADGAFGDEFADAEQGHDFGEVRSWELGAEGSLHSYDKRLAQRSVQEMHGSMVRTMTGTSARSQPLSMCTRGATLAKVGVRTRKRSSFLEPLPSRK